MIEHLRKYTGLIIFVIALLFVGLAFFGDNVTRSMRGNSDPAVLSVDGRTYTQSEYHKSGATARNLGMNLGFYEFISTLGGFGGENEDQTDQRFFVNRLLVQQARQEFGVNPSDEEVIAALKLMPVFQGQNGAYDQAKYNEIATKGLGRFGMTEKDLFELVRDSIATKKLASVLGGGLSSDREVAAESVASRDQQVSIQVARTALSTFQESLKPTDDELKATWETTKDKYMTERKIKLTYVMAKPVYPEPKKEEPKLPDAVTEEAKKAAEKEAADKKAAEEAALAVEKRKITNDLADSFDTFVAELQNSEGKDFEKTAQSHQWELVTTDFFTRSTLPPALAINRRSSSNPEPIGDVLFRLGKSKDLLSSFTEALAIPDGAYLIARLDEEEAARPKTFEEAKEEVRTDYISQKAGEALKKDSDEKAAKIREGLAAGKNFTDLAKELGLEAKALGPFKATDKLDGEADTSLLFQTASTIDPGALADPVMRPDGALFVFVEKREIVKDPARAERVNQAVTGLAGQQERYAFSAWLNEKLETTKVEKLTATP